MKLENNKKKRHKFDFTIITIVKNDECNIENTIRSALSQKNIKIQYIVLDGFSKDRTFDKIQKYKNSVKILRYKDKSFYDGLNHAITFAKGKYIGILNSGDIYFNNTVLNRVKKEVKNLDFIFGNISFYNHKNEITRDWNLKFLSKKKIFFYFIAHSSLFISLDIMRNYLKKYNLKYTIASDTDLIIRLNLLKNIRFKKMNDYLIFMKTGGLSTNYRFFFKKFAEDLSIINSYFGYKFFLIYAKKIFIKLSGFYRHKKKIKLKQQLLVTLKKLNEL